MFCTSCGKPLETDSKFCIHCGATIETEIVQPTSGIKIGYSDVIHDPAFKKYIKNSNRYALIFSMILATIAIIGFFIAGEKGMDGMSNPESLYIGFGVGGMFIMIALLQTLGRKRSKTWDGVVVDKKKKLRNKRVNNGDSSQIRQYMEYTVFLKEDNGKKHEIISDDDDTLFNYYKVGDKIRHHAGLNSYEKYDKTKDDIIFCSACATLCDIKEDTCFRCKCPLLK